MMRKILEIVIDRISVVFSKSENIYKMSKLITEKHDNFSSNMNTNGERKLVEYLSQVLPSDSIIFDIGVNKGEYSKLIQLNFKNPAVYAFDPVKENIEQASKLLSGGGDLYYESGVRL